MKGLKEPKKLQIRNHKIRKRCVIEYYLASVCRAKRTEATTTNDTNY